MASNAKRPAGKKPTGKVGPRAKLVVCAGGKVLVTAHRHWPGAENSKDDLAGHFGADLLTQNINRDVLTVTLEIPIRPAVARWRAF